MWVTNEFSLIKRITIMENEDFVPEEFVEDYNEGLEDGKAGVNEFDPTGYDGSESEWWYRSGVLDGYKEFVSQSETEEEVDDES